MGGCSIDAHGVALTDEVLKDCQASDAVLLGAVGGPKWDDPKAKVRPEQGLLGAAQGARRVREPPAGARPREPPRLLAAQARPAARRGHPRHPRAHGGLYFGQPKGRDRKDGHERAVDTLEYSRLRGAPRRRARVPAREGARRKKVTSVDKANVLESSRLWRQITAEIGKREPGHRARPHARRHRRDAARHEPRDARRRRHREHVRRHPHRRGVGARRVDGHAPVRVHRRRGARAVRADPRLGARTSPGKGIANPVGHDPLGRDAAPPLARPAPPRRSVIEDAVDRAITEGCRTRDLGGTLSTTQMTDEILRRLPA